MQSALNLKSEDIRPRALRLKKEMHNPNNAQSNTAYRIVLLVSIAYSIFITLSDSQLMMILHPKMNPTSFARRPSIQVWRKPAKQGSQSDGPYLTARISIQAKCLSSQTTYFDMLGVAESATQEEIKSAFRSKSKLLHPDVNKKVNPSLSL